MTDKKGFTITELMFAMTFLSVLMIILLGSIIQITRTYNKGITIKRVNQSGRTIGEELTRALQQANPDDIQDKSDNGRLCLGTNSFVWSVPATDGQSAITNSYEGDGGEVVLAKVRDLGGGLCSDGGDIKKSEAKELLGDGLIVRRLTQYSVNASAATETNSSALVSMAYTISTSDAELIDDATGRCKGADGDDFCALNEFSVTVYAKG